MLLSEESYRKIDRELEKFPPTKKRSAAIAALTVAQDEKGWLSPDVIKEVANYLGLPEIRRSLIASRRQVQDRGLFQSALRNDGKRSGCGVSQAEAGDRIR